VGVESRVPGNPDQPGDESAAARPVARDRPKGALEDDRGQLTRIVVGQGPRPEIAVDGKSVPLVQQAERAGIRARGESQVVVAVDLRTVPLGR
jgi:hypothetical protein